MATLGEGVAATGSGIGAGVARESMPESPAAETYGQLIGGFTPAALSAISPTGLIARGGNKVISRFSPNAQKKQAQEAVERVMGEALTGDARAGLSRAKELGKEAPGFSPSIAEATGSPPLIAQQELIEAQATGSFLDRVVARRVQNENAIQVFANTKAPQGDLNPEFVIDSARNRVKTVGETIDRLAAKNVQKQGDLADSLPNVNRALSGENMRNSINQARSDASLRMSARAQELGINDADLSVPFNDWRDGIVSKYAQDSRFADSGSMPDIYKALKADQSITGEVQTTFGDIKAVRERITDELVKALSPVNRDRQKIRVLTRMKKDVDDFLVQLDPVLGENYQKFRQEYFEGFVKPFESGAVFKSRSKDGTGFYKSTDEEVAQLFLRNQSSAKQYRDVFGDDPQMMEALKNSALDDLRETVSVDGVIDSKKLARWKKTHRGALDELPELKRSVDNLETTQTALLDRQNQLAQRRKSIENTALAKHITRFEGGGETADAILDSALKNNKQMAQLFQTVKKDPEALGALKRTMWDKVTQGSSEDILRSIDQHRKSLSILFGKEHFDNIEKVSSMRAMMERVRPPAGSPVQSAPLKGFEEITGMKVPQAGTRYWAFMSGRVPKYYLAFDIAKNALYKHSQRHFDALLREALYDPQVAREMAQSVVEASIPVEKARRLGARMFALGLPYMEDDNESKETPQWPEP